MMTLFTGSGSLPTHQYVFVDSAFIRRERTGFEPCVWFGLHAHPARAWGCHVMLECGAFYRNIPPHALAFRPDAEPWTLSQSQLWDCYGSSFALHVYDYLAGLVCLARIGKQEVEARYLFTAIPIGDGFSEQPDQAKEFLFLETRGGRLTVQPTNSVLFIDASYTTGAVWPSDLKAQFAAYSVEKPWRDERIGPQVKPPVPSPARLRRTRAA